VPVPVPVPGLESGTGTGTGTGTDPRHLKRPVSEPCPVTPDKHRRRSQSSGGLRKY